jgi:hypothetical protein
MRAVAASRHIAASAQSSWFLRLSRAERSSNRGIFFRPVRVIDAHNVDRHGDSMTEARDRGSI